MIKNAFYFILKALFVLEIFKFLSGLFGHVAKWVNKKDMVNFKFYDVTAWLADNHNTNVAQYFREVKAISETFFLANYTLNVIRKLVLDPFLEKIKLGISLDQ